MDMFPNIDVDLQSRPMDDLSTPKCETLTAALSARPRIAFHDYANHKMITSRDCSMANVPRPGVQRKNGRGRWCYLRVIPR